METTEKISEVINVLTEGGELSLSLNAGLRQHARALLYHATVLGGIMDKDVYQMLDDIENTVAEVDKFRKKINSAEVFIADIDPEENSDFVEKITERLLELNDIFNSIEKNSKTLIGVLRKIEEENCGRN